MKFKNDYLSVSRLKRYEQCPRAFKLHYIDKHKSEGGVALDFGKLEHRALELLFQWILDEEYAGPLPEDKLLEFYRQAWRESGLTAIELYQEGIMLLRDYVRRHPGVDHLRILGVEIPIDITVGEFKFVGSIDRVDRSDDDETIEIIDYKTNRMIFSREEVDVDLQMSAYAIAAKIKWPWAKQIKFAFHLLRHGFSMETRRSAEQLEDAKAYIVELGERTESDAEYAPKLSSNCGYCDHRKGCDAYALAVSKKDERVALGEDLVELAEARERVATIARIAYQRQKELDTILKTHLAELDKDQELVLGQYKYKLVSYARETVYPLEQTVDAFVRVLGMKQADVLGRIMSIDKKKIEELEGDVAAEHSVSKMKLLRARLDAVSVKIPGAPRIQSSKKKGLQLTKEQVLVLDAASGHGKVDE